MSDCPNTKIPNWLQKKGKNDYFLKTKKMVGNTTSDESFIYNNHPIRHGEKTRQKKINYFLMSLLLLII